MHVFVSVNVCYHFFFLCVFLVYICENLHVVLVLIYWYSGRGTGGHCDSFGNVRGTLSLLRDVFVIFLVMHIYWR